MEKPYFWFWDQREPDSVQLVMGEEQACVYAARYPDLIIFQATVNEVAFEMGES